MTQHNDPNERRQLGLEHGERIYGLEIRMKTQERTTSTLMDDVKKIQIRWSLLMGAAFIVFHSPDIFHFLAK